MKKIFFSALAGLIFGVISGYVTCFAGTSGSAYSGVNWSAFSVFPGMMIYSSLYYLRHTGYGQGTEADTPGIVFWNGLFWMLMFFAISSLIIFCRKRPPKLS
jgi:hypothetical protein